MAVDNMSLLKKLERLINALVKSLNITELKNLIQKFIKQEYDKGLIKAEKQFDINFVRNEKDLKFLQNYVDTNITAITDDISKDMKQIAQRAMLSGDNIEDIKNTIRSEFSDKKYMDRFKTIVRTEGNRAGNQAQMSSAQEVNKIKGITIKKYLDVTLDDRTSPICLEEHRKYGDESKAIPLNEQFEVNVKNKSYISQNPPFHPNCRTVVMFVEVEE